MSEYPKVAAFDCYGTLIDWEGGLGNFLYDFSLRNGEEPTDNGDAMRRRWEAIQFEIIQGPYQSYKNVLAQSLREWAGERGLPYHDEDGEALVRAMRSWQPFPDTRPALSQARDMGLKLAILSNTDRDIIAHSLKHLEVPFDVVITAEDCGSYKPSPANFQRLLQELGVPPSEVLHVAFGFKYDIGPANEAGMRSAWVNRHVEPTPEDAAPDYIWRDLWGLPLLAGAAGPGFGSDQVTGVTCLARPAMSATMRRASSVAELAELAELADFNDADLRMVSSTMSARFLSHRSQLGGPGTRWAPAGIKVLWR